ncbi:unnamed protein product [Rhizophagus irregularis]|nr:unnamed protein product [Rhizophagus irregularis]
MTTQASTQAQVIPKFGEQKKAFSINELKRLVNAAKSMSDLNQAKRYLCSYFIPCADPHGVFWSRFLILCLFLKIYSGARFSRGSIARLGERLQSRYPTHKFQILLPYENWKPGG